jgi:hypothetical protein
MKSFRRGRLLVSLMTLVAASFLVAGTVAAEPAPVGATHAYRDYLATAGAAKAVGGVGSEQCGAALSRRVGNWVCPAPRTGVAARRPGVNATGYCDVWGCRYRYSDFSADADATGIYGFGGTMLGEVKVLAEYQLTGAQTWSKPVQYTNTRATRNVVFTGDLLNAAPGADGSQVDGAWSLYLAGNVPANTMRTWDPNGYKSYDNTMWDHSQVHQWSFEVDGYPGYWYLFVKSTCTHTNDKATYRFYAVDQVPANATGGGWNQ